MTTSRSDRRESNRPLFVVAARDATVCPAAPTTQLLHSLLGSKLFFGQTVILVERVAYCSRRPPPGLRAKGRSSHNRGKADLNSLGSALADVTLRAEKSNVDQPKQSG